MAKSGQARKPRKHLMALTERLRRDHIPEGHLPEGWDIWVCDVRQGTCWYRHKRIVIPAWAMRDGRPGYREYYIAHECAHAQVGPAVAAHGPEFMKKLSELCPPEAVHYELDYKPRNAKAAGIARKESHV